jgi:hypothetical protein
MAELSSEELEKIVKEEDNSIKPMKEFESPEKLYQELIASVRKSGSGRGEKMRLHFSTISYNRLAFFREA